MVKEFVVYIEERVIYAKAFGIWNEGIYLAYEQAMTEAIKEVKSPFFEIIDLRKWKIGTLDMINLAVKRHKYAIEAGRACQLTIAKKGAMNYLITQNHIYKRTERYVESDYINFEDVNSCCAYLESNNIDTVRLCRFINELEGMAYEEFDV